MYEVVDPDMPGILQHAPTGAGAINIIRTTIHSGLMNKRWNLISSK